MENLSIKEKARIEFDERKRWEEILWNESSDEERREIEENRKKSPNDEKTLKNFEQRFRETHALIDELKQGNYFQSINGVSIYDLFIDTMKGSPDHNFHPRGFLSSKITNLHSNPNLLKFLSIDLKNFHFHNLKFRCVSNKRLEHVLQNGTDREDAKTFVSPYVDKVLEYGIMPKLLLVYDSDGIGYVGGIEGHEHRFIDYPKSILQSAIRIHLQE